MNVLYTYCDSSGFGVLFPGPMKKEEQGTGQGEIFEPARRRSASSYNASSAVSLKEMSGVKLALVDNHERVHRGVVFLGEIRAGRELETAGRTGVT